MGWAVASVIGGVVSSSLYGTANTALNGILQGAIGGLTTMLVLRLVNPSIHWIQILIVALGWTIGWTIAHYYGPIVYDALEGSIGNIPRLVGYPGGRPGGRSRGYRQPRHVLAARPAAPPISQPTLVKTAPGRPEIPGL